MRRLVLASASPRRKELLTQAGYVFEVQAAQVDEDPLAGEDPIAYVVRLAREKAESVFFKLTSDLGPQSSQVSASRPGAPNLEGIGSREPGSGIRDQREIVVLGADTTVELDGQILAKPADAADAARMLRALSGRTHRVITGVAVAHSQVSESRPGAPTFEKSQVLETGRPGARHSGLDPELRIDVAAEVTGVRFLALSEAEIRDYVASGEPMDKAGAYGIQGRAARWIPRVEGCYFNVVGLPLALTAVMLEAAGIVPGQCVSTSASSRARSGS